MLPLTKAPRLPNIAFTSVSGTSPTRIRNRSLSASPALRICISSVLRLRRARHMSRDRLDGDTDPDTIVLVGFRGSKAGQSADLRDPRAWTGVMAMVPALPRARHAC